MKFYRHLYGRGADKLSPPNCYPLLPLVTTCYFFVPGHRASEHIFSLRTLIDQHVTHSPRGKLYTCFVDVKKAFDSIWHQGLLYKLLKYNIGGSFYKIISSMYSNSICCVKDNYTRSEFFNYDKGVRQGCILSPLLFNLYLNELPLILNNNAKDSILLPDGSHFNCLLYADDLLLISTSAEGLQQSLDRLSKYCQDWLLKINPTKTKVIVFQKKSRKSAIDKHNFMVSNENIEIVNNYTYLGVKFSANGILQITRKT